MNQNALQKNHEVTLLNADPRQVLDKVRQAECLHPGLLYSYRFPDSIEAEEVGIAGQAAELSMAFEWNRKRVTQALKAIPAHLFKVYDLPKNGGVDIGCGSTGFMRHVLLEGLVSHHGWVELDANPQAVEENRKLHPDSAMRAGSYHRLKELGLKNKLNMVSGLSSLDATAFLDHAVDEIAQSLRPGGWLFHMQDVRPGLSSSLQTLEHEGVEAPFKIEAADRSGQNIISFEVRGEQVPVVELFRRRMALALQNTPALEPVLNHWVVARRTLRYGESANNLLDSRTYYMNMMLEHMTFPGPTEEAYAVVTLARKK